MQSKAQTVDEYLAELPPDRRAAISAIRQVILTNLDKVYEEGISYGMIGYYVPHRVYPAGYHCNPKQPLPFAGLASQKNYMSIYLMCQYGDEGADALFRAAWAKTGKKLDMGKCCIRFKKLDDVALDVLGETIRRASAKKYIERYETLLAGMAVRSGKSARKSSPAQPKPKPKTPAKSATRPKRK